MPKKKGKNYYRNHGLSLRKGQHNPNELAKENKQAAYRKLLEDQEDKEKTYPKCWELEDTEEELKVSDIFTGLWTQMNTASANTTYIYLDNDSKAKYTVIIKDDQSWEARYYDMSLPACIALAVPTYLTCAADYVTLRETLTQCTPCQGLEGFTSLELLERDEFVKRNGVFFHNSCERMLHKLGRVLQRCGMCHKKRDVLRMRLKRQSDVGPSSNTAFTKLKREDLERHARDIAAQKRVMERDIKALKKRLDTLQNPHQTMELLSKPEETEDPVVTLPRDIELIIAVKNEFIDMGNQD